MNERPNGRTFADWATIGITAVISIAAVVLMVLRGLTHVPFFDETMHARFLWLLSIGLRPEADFFTNYPILGYILSLPYLRLFPESAYVVLALRALSVAVTCLIAFLLFCHGRKISGNGVDGLLPVLLIVAAPDIGAFLVEYSIDSFAALAAIGAMTLFFRPSRPAYVALACALSLFSVTITPKYSLLLLLGLPVYLTISFLPADWRRTTRMASVALAGTLVAALLVALLYHLVDTSFVDNFRLSHVLMARFRMHIASLPLPETPLTLVWVFVSHHPVLIMVLAAGIAGWVRNAWRCGGLTHLPGAAILLAVAVSLLVLKTNLLFEQYLAPLLFCTALLAPYIFPDRESGPWVRWYRLSLLVAAAATIAFQFSSAVQEFRETPLNVRSACSLIGRKTRVAMSPPMLTILKNYDACLHLVPKDERVLAVWPYHPLFRRDLTWLTYDEVPSYGEYLAADDPALKNFAPEVLLEALERTPPAYIVPARLEQNYPPGWKDVCDDFLKRHAPNYVKSGVFYFRRDLLLQRSDTR
jgi:hypothetical protein